VQHRIHGINVPDRLRNHQGTLPDSPSPTGSAAASSGCSPPRPEQWGLLFVPDGRGHGDAER